MVNVIEKANWKCPSPLKTVLVSVTGIYSVEKI